MQVKIGQAVVNKINILALRIQPAAENLELAGIRDHCIDTVSCKHLLEQNELRTEILLRRTLVHDADTAQYIARNLRVQLTAKHVDKCKLEIARIKSAGDEVFHLAAACFLGTRNVQQEQHAARIGVYLDQLRAVVGQVKVIAKKDAFRSGAGCGNVRHPLQDFFLISIESGDVPIIGAPAASRSRASLSGV